MSAPSAVESIETEVVIVGAGIAGTTLGYLLARSGIDTVLVERHTDLAREFRGFGFQPLALRYFDEMDVLEDVYALDPVRIERPRIHAFGSNYTIADISTYSERYDHVLFTEQPPLLGLFIERASEYDNFTYRDGTPVTGLLTDDGSVVGVRATDRAADEQIEIRSRVVVASDGRYSTVRGHLDIDPNRFDSDVELVWVKLPQATSADPADIYLNEHGVLANFGLPGGEVQFGLLIEAGTYPEIRDRGHEAFRDRLVTIAPKYEAVVDAHFTGFDQCSLLRVAPGITEKWTRDGLVLIGDAAHIASPFGGQGNLMALKDAVALHPILANALEERNGDERLSAETLRAFESDRRPAVEKTVRLQRRMGSGVGWIALNSDVLPPRVFDLVFKTLFTVGEPIVRDRIRHLLLGTDPPRVARSHFVTERMDDASTLPD